MRVVRSGYVRRSRRDGVGFVWFTLIAMPVLMLSLALSTDFARLVIINHQMRNIADSAAVAAAWRTQPATVVLDEATARQVAEETACEALSHVRGIKASNERLPSAFCSENITVEVVFDQENDSSTYPGEGNTRATVTVYYNVENLIFPAYFGEGRSIEDIAVTRSAVVCIPTDTAGATGGACARPR